MAVQARRGGAGTVDLTLPQFRVLGILAEGSSAASGLADRLAVRRPSITAIIDGLVARGLVDRRQEDTDRRRVALRLTDEGARILADADRAVDDYLASIAGHLPGKDEAMALRSLELWGRAMAASREGPEGRPTRREGAARPMSKTEDRLDPAATAGRAGNGNGDAGGSRTDGRRADCRWRPTSRWAPLSRYEAPKATVDPDRSKSWIKRAAPIVMAHKLQLFSALDLLVPRPDHPGVDPQDPPERHHELADPTRRSRCTTTSS